MSGLAALDYRPGMSPRVAILVKPSARVSIHDCLRAVSKEMDISLYDLVGPSRKRHLVRVRWLAMWLAKQLSDASVNAIGQHFERDHTSVMHALRRFEGLREKYPAIRKLSDDMKTKLAAK